MKQYKAYLFDFDYTLADSSRGIVKCFRNVLERHGYKGIGFHHQAYDRKDAGGFFLYSDWRYGCFCAGNLPEGVCEGSRSVYDCKYVFVSGSG